MINLNFYDENCEINLPSNLKELRNIISNTFQLETRDTAELIIYYFDSNKSKNYLIEENDYVKLTNFKKLPTIMLEISEESRLFQQSKLEITNDNQFEIEKLKIQKEIEEKESILRELLEKERLAIEIVIKQKMEEDRIAAEKELIQKRDKEVLRTNITKTITKAVSSSLDKLKDIIIQEVMRALDEVDNEKNQIDIKENCSPGNDIFMSNIMISTAPEVYQIAVDEIKGFYDLNGVDNNKIINALKEAKGNVELAIEKLFE